MCIRDRFSLAVDYIVVFEVPACTGLDFAQIDEQAITVVDLAWIYSILQLWDLRVVEFAHRFSGDIGFHRNCHRKRLLLLRTVTHYEFG